MKYLASSLMIVCFLLSGGSRSQAVPQTDQHRATKAEEKEAQDLAVQFTILFSESQDLTPVIRDFYFRDFLERYKSFKIKELNNKPVDLYFAPGLAYNSQLLTTAGSKDWEGFYVATNNFLVLGFIAALKASSDETPNIKASDMYPSEVIDLLRTNPTLANMIVRKAPANAVATVEEMHAATTTLARAVTMIREKHQGRPLITNKDGLIKTIMNDEFFKPRVEVLDESFFSFPKNTRILFIKTPVGLQLMLARDAERLKIFWTEIIAE